MCEENVNENANPRTTVESNNQESSVASASKDKETDSEVAKAQTGIAGVTVNIEPRMESQKEPAKKIKTSGKILSKKKKSNKDEKEDKSKT